MPSLKVLESDKNCTSDSFNNSIESAGNDGCSSVKEVNSSQSMANTVINNNGNIKEQPVNPLQQIILIIEHKIRNLEKRKNKLETYKTIEKSGKRLTGDQKNAVSKYEECLTSLELTRELCKQFQSIAAVANKDAKKEARRSAFLKAQQENAKVREVLAIQDVLKRLSDKTVQCDFRNGENGACKISAEDLTMLERLYEETQPKRPKNTLESTFVLSVKQAADHLTAVVDGRNKSFENTTYIHIKNLITDVQDCGYFEKDILSVEPEPDNLNEDYEGQSIEQIHSTDDNVTNISEEVKKDETCTNSEMNKELNTPHLVNLGNTLIPVSSDTNNSPDFGESPSAAAVPTPSFPLHSQVRYNSNATASTLPVVDTPNITSSMHMCPPNNCSNTGIIPQNATHVQTNASSIVQTGTVTISVIQPSTVEPQNISGQKIGATTVQAVESDYFKQHYIQQQMRPIHEVIGTANFFFLQESEIDKPDVVSTPVPFVSGHHGVSNISNQQSLPPQNQTICDTKNSTNHLTSEIQQTSVGSVNQASMISAQTSTINKQPFQNIVAPTVNYNPSLHKQTDGQMKSIDNIQSRQISASKYNETGCTSNVSTASTVGSAETYSQNNVTTQVQLEHHALQKQQPQLESSSFKTGHQGKTVNPDHKPNVQQFPTLIQSLHNSSHHISTNKRSNNTIEPIREKLKSHNTTDNISMVSSTRQNQPFQSTDQRDDWNKSQKFATLAKPEEQWPVNSNRKNNPVEDSLNDKTVYNLTLPSPHQLKQTAASISTSSKDNLSSLGASNRVHHNESSAPSYDISNVPETSNVKIISQQSLQTQKNQPLHQSERNTRGTSNNQFTQNSGGNIRFSNVSSANNPISTFYKNNERFYQQNQSNSYVSNKSDSGYHQRSSMFKNRKDNANDPTSMIAGCASMTGNNLGGTNSNNGSMDFRSSARPINSTRNTGPPSARPQQRNHSGNSNYEGHRGSSNTRGQHTINA
ncbi:probable serine/threonine-protein kinase DDB_G0282963 [Topomyia yanbarensis]|uniref:probable serine/threonine-protein kinase DDB_G0282963 n=1 Tax=Topomyia yanbarensis TaxID=2498891 RepID=UPI00273CE039|nr:probable serine/threonine-protein kinase DDB_G0282963 [Topomyia yanbarensis]